jgi:hypothetical protein
MDNGKQASLSDVCDELRINNRLIILSLVRGGIQNKDIAGALGLSNSVLSKMFPKGLLKRVARLSKRAAVDGRGQTGEES